MVGVCYHLSGFIATEREMGMSSLLEAMMPNLRRWQPQVARVLSYHLGFSIIYLPGWILMGIIIAAGLFADTARIITVFFNILAGFSLTTFSILGAMFFKRAQLSGITVSIVTLLLGILAQVLGSTKSTGTVAILSFLFAPCNYVFYIIWLARYEQQELPANLLKSAPNNWKLPGIAFWVFSIVQILLYLILAIFIERWIHGTASKGRSVVRSSSITPTAEGSLTGTVELRNFSKHYHPTWFQRWTNFLRQSPKTTVIAVEDLTLTAGKGQILVLVRLNSTRATLSQLIRP
jgi:ATP-binding cassette, subfamily A (ABC1), member 3